MWQKLMPSCFGSDDLQFGMHPRNEESAKEMMARAFQEKFTIDDICVEAEKYLTKRGATNEHIEEQLRRIKDYEFLG